MSSQSYGFQCGSNYQTPSFGGSNTSSYSHGAAVCQNVVYQYQCHESYTSSCYQQSHHSNCGSGSQNVSVTTIALQDAAKMGAGVQGDVGCSLDEYGQPQAPQLSGLPTGGDNTDGDVIHLVGTNSNTSSVLGDGVADQITVDSGNSNTLVAGNGAGDQLTVGLFDSGTGTYSGGGNNNILVAGNGDGDQLLVASGDGNQLVAGDGMGDQLAVGSLSDPTLVANNNILVAGNGANDFLSVGTGNGNELFAGNGDGDILFVNTGDSNALIAGDGAGDILLVNTGNNNDLHAGNGAGDALFVLTGDNNCLTVGNGDGSGVSVGTGTSNDLEVGNGNNSGASVGTGDNNLLHVGNGAQDNLGVGDGNHNTLCVGSGAGDNCSVGTGDYNLLHAGDGAGDFLSLGTGNYNALIAGNGAGDLIVAAGNNNILALGDGAGDIFNLQSGNNNSILDGNGQNDMILVGGSVGVVGFGVNAGNDIVIGNGEGDQAWGSLGDGNNYLTGKGNDLVHTGGGADLVYVHNHTEQSTAAMADPYHLTVQDSEAQNLFADGGNDTFVLQGTQLNSCQSYSSHQYGCTYSTALTWQSELKQVGGDAPGLGTTVMTGGGGVEKYWFSDLWGNAVITDFNSVHGDRVMIGGVWDGNLSGSIHTQYIHSAYDTANTGNVDLLITFGTGVNNISQSITLIDYKPQDAGNLFNNATFNNIAASESTLANIFDFSHADNLAVTNQVASLAAQHLILQ